jgi:hypothetical protein
MSLKRALPLHPLFFIIYPVLFLYAHNARAVPFSAFALYSAVLLAAMALLFAIFYLALRDAGKAALAVTVVILLVLYYVPIHTALEHVHRGELSHKLSFPLYLSTTSLLYYWTTRSQPRVAAMTKILNTMAAVLVLMSLAPVVPFLLRNLHAEARQTPGSVGETIRSDRGDSRPNVYHIILDRYAANATLKEQYNFDNQEFIDFLTKQGFSIAPDSTANYLKTGMSLASTLNMEYINYLREHHGNDPSDWWPIVDLLKDHKVQRYFKQLGYKYIHIGSWWETTARNPYADRNYNYYISDEFSLAFLSTSTIPLAASYLHVNLPIFHNLNVDVQEEQRAAALYAIEKIRQTAQDVDPSFVFAHILIPHPPRLRDNRMEATKRDEYISRIVFINRELKGLIQDLLSRQPTPVILIQADEGPFPVRYQKKDPDFDWRTASRSELDRKFRILNAMYLPGVRQSEVYPSITAVNTYRLVFSRIFKQDFQLLPDRNYCFVNEVRHLYDFFDVTDVLAAAAPGARQASLPTGN